uniref:Uncharacterized protein n=1 Tax=Arundo donax TaxID=35708 RepID=A0A0A9A8H3_ARUDO
MQYFGTLQLKQWFDFSSYTMNRMGLQQHKQISTELEGSRTRAHTPHQHKQIRW